MIDSKAAPIVAVVLAAILAVLIFFAPRSVQSPRFSELNPQEARLELGRAYVEGSANPMVGIRILQEVLKNDPKNYDVRWYLGAQAINTGQYDKAIGHLSVLSRELKGEEKAKALSALGYAYQQKGLNDSAMLCYGKVFEISKDSLLLQSLKMRINAFINP